LRLSFFLLALSSGASAQYTYIVPVAGATSGFHSQYFAEITALNPNATPATLRYEAFYPIPGSSSCTLRSPQTILPRSIVGVSQACFTSLHAQVLSSDQPLSIMVDVYASFLDVTGTKATRFELQPIEVATDWIVAESEAMISNVMMFDQSDKANIVIVNPNDFLLTIDVHVDRPELSKSADVTLAVQPRSFFMTALAPIPTPELPPGSIPRVYSGRHHVTVRANGKFYAGVSNTFEGSLVFRRAIPLQP
jgi:hypothetical protein